MATDVTKSVEDAEMTECEEDKVVTMMDVLQEQENFEEDANAVLGGSDDKNCTYSKGYIKRQALYACMTCCSEAKSDPAKRAGLCLACSLTCHENHELIELYTKRNFRCDCGNSKFNSNPCQLAPKKDKCNEENSYNQNFSGLYCVCRRPYPDPDSENEDVMIQCTVCEDWYHGTHLETTVPNSENYSEMICKGCMEKYDFLHSYSYLVVNVESSDVDVVNVAENENKTCNGDSQTDVTAVKDSEKTEKNEDISMTPEKEISSSNENKEETKKKVEDDVTNNSKMETNSDVDGNVENPSTVVSCNTNDDTDIKKEESIADNTNEQNTSSDQNKDIINSEMQQDTESNTDNTAKETEDKNTTEMANDEKNKEDENAEEERRLADPESESCTSKTNLDITETGSQEDIKTTHENGEIHKENDGDNSMNTDELNNLEKEESQGTKEETVNSTSNDEKVVQETSQGVETKSESTSSGNNPVDVNDQDVAKDEVEGKSIEECSLNNSSVVDKEEDSSNHKGLEKRKLSTEESTDSAASKKSKLEEVSDKPCTCPKDVKKVYRGATFWPSTFRQRLCTCNVCLSMYKDLSVMFLIDTEDTVIAYESLGKEKTNGKPSQYEKGLEALSSLDRIQQINALTEYNKMRDKLLDFLKSFKDRKEVVKEEDIKAFFAGMKPKREPEGVYFCR
ncbi:unnamed protein product [Danaus chrysippus]|uniref:(African queen) hypothetical protein n=1 Tax=Danaus chrysippus TaxID=151541 RepID=A0A8J2R6X2_9NEOP|nr:unnamed protein product [Danaus chrysippus]